MKKPKQRKPRKPSTRPANRQATVSPAPHSTRRQPKAIRPQPRQARPAHRPVSPTTLYRPQNPLRISASDDQRTFRLLVLPFAVLALLLAIVPSLHVYPTLQQLIAETPVTQLEEVATVESKPLLAVTQTISWDKHEPQPIQLATTAGTAVTPAAPSRSVAMAAPNRRQAKRVTGQHNPAATPRPPESRVANQSPERAVTTISNMHAALPPQGPALLAMTSPNLKAVALSHDHVALPLSADGPRLTLAAVTGSPETFAANASWQSAWLSPLPPEPYPMTCPVDGDRLYAGSGSGDFNHMATGSHLPFGEQLAHAAAAQTGRLVIYDDKYRQISRIGGDVPALYGVCTDLVVRAYRMLGIDLQMLLQASRLGKGDSNIDHRRTETLRRYFARYGTSLTVTSFPENFLPGDIVTYWRPQNSGSRSHIAIVAAGAGPSGRPMIIHNRGWGPQIEDALFVDQITGHYRYDGSKRPPLPEHLRLTKAKPFIGSLPVRPASLRRSHEDTSTSEANF